jgi:hypothetical protein
MVAESDQLEIVGEYGTDRQNLFYWVIVFQHCARSPCRYEIERVPTVAAAVLSIAIPPLKEADVMSFDDTDNRMPKIRPVFLLSEE